MTIPARARRAGKWWHKQEVTITRPTGPTRNIIRLTIGTDLELEFTPRQTTTLINSIADLIETQHLARRDGKKA